MTRSTIVLLAMLAIGGHALITGLRYRLGTYKAPYFGRQSLRLYAELGISGGFLFLILSVSTLLTRDMEVSGRVTTAVSFLAYFALTALAINWVLGILNHPFLKPAWVIWLESHYDKTEIRQLRQLAQEMGLKQWEAQVMTQPDLEMWVTAVLPP